MPELCDIANDNMRKLNYLDVNIYNEDARFFNKIDYYNSFFMFNPFPEEAMVSVINRLQESLARNDRKICIVYINCVHEKLLMNGINNLYCRYSFQNIPRYGCKTAIYTNY